MSQVLEAWNPSRSSPNHSTRPPGDGGRWATGVAWATSGARATLGARAMAGAWATVAGWAAAAAAHRDD